MAAIGSYARSTGTQSGAAKKDKPQQVRETNIFSAKAVSDAVRTSLGPRGMDKMIVSRKGQVTITNDGATILKEMNVVHPIAQMLVELAKAQDVEAGDGTTTVVVIAGSLLSASIKLLEQGLHPTTISEGFQLASTKAQEILRSMAMPVDLNDRASLLQSATTSLSSKVVSQNSLSLAPMSVDAVLKILESKEDKNVDLNDIRVITKLGGTLEDSELIEDGLVLNQRASHAGSSAVTLVDNAKIAMIQFCLSSPKTNMDNNVIVTDYTQMDRILREEKQYILSICKEIQKSGCNVLLVQKSILRDSVNETALHFLNRMKIMVIKDVERTEVELICKTLNCRPIASVDHMRPEFLGSAKLVEEISTADDRFVKISGVQNPGKTISIILRGSNNMILEEADRSLHDSLCVVRSIVKCRHLICGGGAPEIQISIRLAEYARTLSGSAAVCVKAFGEALEMIPITLAENGGLNPIEIITELRKQHFEGNQNAGISVLKGCISDMKEENVISPLLVISSAINLAAETVRCILKIDDMVQAIR